MLLPPAFLRLAYHATIRDDPYMTWNLVVSFVNDDFARDLALGGGPWTLLRSPWYPALTSVVYLVLGGPAGMRAFQWALGCIACVVVYALGRRVGGARAAVISYAAAVLYGPALFYEGELLEQSVAAFLLLCGLAAAIPPAAGDVPSAWRLACAGAAFGASAMMRPDHAAAIPLAAAALAIPAGGAAARLRRVGAFLAPAAAGLALVAWPGALLPVKENHADINAAIAFYLGNRPGSDGHRSVFPQAPELPTTDPEARAAHMTGLDLTGIRLARAATGGGMETVAPYWMARSREEILADLPGWGARLARKGWLFFNGFLLTTQKDLYVARDASWILALLIRPGFLLIPLGLVIPLAAAAVAAGRPSWRTGALLSVPGGCLVTTLLFTHDARFQHAASLVFVALSGPGAIALWHAVRARRALAPAAALVFLAAANADAAGTHHVPVADESFRRGIMHLDQGRPAAAARAFLRAIEADPAHVPSLDSLSGACRRLPACGEEIAALRRLGERGGGFDLGYTIADLLHQAGRLPEAREAAVRARAQARGRPEAHALLARVEADAGNPDAALAALEAGVAGVPDNAGLRLDLGRALMSRQRHEEALPHLRAAQRGAPGPEAPAAAAWALAALGRIDEAAATLSDALRGNPGNVSLLGLLAQVRGQQGRRREEQQLYEEILRLEPDHAEALWRLALSLRATGDAEGAAGYARRAADAGHAEARRFAAAGAWPDGDR